MDNQTKIKCPNCGTSIDVQDILSHQLEEEIKQKYQSQLAEEKKNDRTDQKWREGLTAQQKELAEIYESRGYDDASIKKRLSSPVPAGSQEELHAAINRDIRGRNACRERYSLTRMERLMPTRESIIDLYSYDLFDEWLNEPDRENPNYKPNMRFAGYANRIVS